MPTAKKDGRPRAPGLEWRPRAGGAHAPYWCAPRAAVKQGYPVSTVPLATFSDRPEELVARCHVLQAEVLEWTRRAEQVHEDRYDGTLGSLLRLFQSHKSSPYRQKRHQTQQFYATYCKLLEVTVGGRKIESLNGLDFRHWHAELVAPVDGGERRVRRAQSAITTLRRVISFGVELRLKGSADVAAILREMRFETPTPRVRVLSYAHALAIIAKAHEMGRPSIALAQAIAFDLTLRQKDIIGEWVPDATGAGGIVDRGRRWDRGLLWSQIDQAGVLSKPTSKSNGRKVVEFDLALHALVSAEIARVPLEKRIGPMVLDEAAGIPWRKRHFGEVWREIATAAGVPSNVWQMDSRAGGLTESTDAGADLESARHQAGHSNISTTARYSRGGLAKTSLVAKLRSAHRVGNVVETDASNELPTGSVG
jgi:hypothetical protein